MVAPTRSRALRPRPPRRSAPRLRPVRVVLVHALDKRKAENDRVDEQRLAEVLPLPADPPRRYHLGSNAATAGLARAYCGHRDRQHRRLPPDHRHRPVLQRACGRGAEARPFAGCPTVQARAPRVSTRTAAPRPRHAPRNPCARPTRAASASATASRGAGRNAPSTIRRGRRATSRRSARALRQTARPSVASPAATWPRTSRPPMRPRPARSAFSRPATRPGACASSVDCDAYTRVSERPVRRPIAGKPAPPRTTPGLRSLRRCSRPTHDSYDEGARVREQLELRVGHIVWPTVKGTAQMYSEPVIDYVSHKAVPDWTCSSARVARAPTPINIVLAHGQTDDAGTITLPVPFYVNAAGVPATDAHKLRRRPTRRPSCRRSTTTAFLPASRRSWSPRCIPDPGEPGPHS